MLFLPIIKISVFSFLFPPESHADNIIRVVTIIYPPYGVESKESYNFELDKCTIGMKCEKLINVNGTKKSVTTCITGFTIEIFDLVLKYANLPAIIKLYVVEDGKYGGIDKNGEWNGMIGDIVKGKADMAVAALSVTKIRSTVVDFTAPYSENRMGMVFKPSMSDVSLINFVFVSQISHELIFAILLLIVGTIALQFTTENNFLLKRLINKERKGKYYPMKECITHCIGLALQRDLGGKVPNKLKGKVIAVTFSFGMAILVTAYTASLTAGQINEEENNPFIGSQDERVYITLLLCNLILVVRKYLVVCVQIALSRQPISYKLAFP